MVGEGEGDVSVIIIEVLRLSSVYQAQHPQRNLSQLTRFFLSGFKHYLSVIGHRRTGTLSIKYFTARALLVKIFMQIEYLRQTSI